MGKKRSRNWLYQKLRDQGRIPQETIDEIERIEKEVVPRNPQTELFEDGLAEEVVSPVKTAILAKAREVNPCVGMNGAESSFARELMRLQACGIIQSWKYEPVLLRLGEDCQYKPDFMVVDMDGHILFYEVKAMWKERRKGRCKGKYKTHWEDDARVKIKVAAAVYPQFRFIGVAWHPEEERHHYEHF